MIKEFFSKLKDERGFGDVLKSKGMSLKFVSDKNQLKKETSPFHNGTLITGKQFTEKYSKELGKFKNKFSVKSESFSEVYRIMKRVSGNFIIGFGGGRVLDVAKMVAYQTGGELILIPSAPTHDGLISKNSALIINGSKKSFPVNYPKKVIVPKYLWNSSGYLKNFGELDVLSNIIALQDVSLAMDEINFKPQEEYMKLSMLAVKYALENSMEALAEALFLSGLAMENSSRYCSGSDHEIEKILMPYFKNSYFHGQLAGTGALISSKVYEEYSKKFRNLFFDPKHLFEELVEIMNEKNILKDAIKPLKEGKKIDVELKKASYIRPERYTIWNKINSEKIEWKNIIDGIVDAC